MAVRPFVHGRVTGGARVPGTAFAAASQTYGTDSRRPIRQGKGAGGDTSGYTAIAESLLRP